MTLTNGVDETYYKSFVLTEEGLKDFQKVLENASQRFPAPAEVTYRVYTSSFRYFETRRIEDVLHDLEVQREAVIHLILQADFIEQPDRIEDNMLQKGRDNWFVRVSFVILQKGFWDTYNDKIIVRVQSEDRKWATDYIDRIEELVYKIPTGNRSPNIILWLYAIPLSILVSTYLSHLASPKHWLTETTWFILFILEALACLLMVLAGVGRSVFGYNPYLFRVFFGPNSGFVWGQGKEDYEDDEKVRQVAFWVVGIVFLFVLFTSIQFATR
ncbi:MAG: hypothetical protein KA473_15575 [Anaerolineales bacterium]|nr:hypothetical protein [Anaerolineales bacterium]MBP6210852.1 hypothetical protein [Anaerolineales bacterium]MBP8164532.1 hypothetical protein [Anaerolineales bacterium]